MMRGADKKGVPEYGDFLVPNDKQEYKIFEYGNFPYIEMKIAKDEDAQKRPKNGIFRLKLPCDADWTNREDKSYEAMMGVKKDD